jgi:outer membrane receptor for ferrienterochelin and colicin
MYPEDLIFQHNPLNECSGGAFVIDRWQATDSLAFEGQFRQDYSNDTGDDWSTRLATIIDLNKDIDEHIRVAFARSYRAPKAFLRQTDTQRLPLDSFGLPGFYGFSIYGNDDIDNEGLQSYEIGYDRELVKDVHFSTNVYKQRYTDLIGYVGDSGPVPGATYTFTPGYNKGADAYGSETEITWQGSNASVSAWYAFNKFEDDGRTLGTDTTQQLRSNLPAEHKAGLTGRLLLPDDFVLNVNYKYASFTDTTHLDGRPLGHTNTSESNVINITLSRAFKINKTDGEIMIGVSDLFNETERVVETVGQVYYPYETPGRIFFARLQMKF